MPSGPESARVLISFPNLSVVSEIEARDRPKLPSLWNTDEVTAGYGKS